ncbi:MAG TPA: glycosyltransferase, partial [Microthrixaceae bacterium]|nr:glycosyltransferase [Microthrixaceae bacterium]
MVAVTLALIIATAGYLVAAAVLSLRRVDAPDAGEPLNYLFVVPCLNEELVIANTLDSLMALPSKRTHVLVVDDGSTDGTSAVVARYPTERVTILRRDLPHALQ